MPRKTLNPFAGKAKARDAPLWGGPCDDGPQGGVTYSLLSRFLCCRERFRLYVVEGLRPAEKFSAPLDFGTMWHCLEESHARMPGVPIDDLIEGAFAATVKELYQKHPHQREEVSLWASKCAVLFAEYVDHWAHHPDVIARTPLFQERAFDVPHELPSGRVVRLRGKWDSVDLIDGGVWLQENKSKSRIDPEKIERHLRFDLQTMMYLIALGRFDGYDTVCKRATGKSFGPIRGVRYNVVHRSSHKSADSMLKKLREDRADGRVGEWFARWKVAVTEKEIVRFCRECLNPILEQLVDWWEWVSLARVSDSSPFAVSENGMTLHWRHPFGVYNVLDEGGSGDLDAYLDTRSEAGLRRVDDLFPELKEIEVA